MSPTEAETLRPHEVGHDQRGRPASTGSAVDQSCPCLVLVYPFSHRVKVLSQGGMRLVLDGDVKDLQAVQLRVGNMLESAGVNDEGDVSAGQHADVQSRVQISEEEAGRDLRDPHDQLQEDRFITAVQHGSEI